MSPLIKIMAENPYRPEKIEAYGLNNSYWL